MAIKSGLAQPVYDDLRQRIVGMQLCPGAALSPRELAEDYGISQSPVREALLQLQDDGFVRMHPQARTVVTRIGISQLYEVHFLRLALETSVTRALSLDCPEDVIARARDAIHRQEGAQDEGDFRQAGDLFHRTLFEAAGQGPLHALLRQRSGHVARVEHLTGTGAIDHSVLDAHDGIVTALAKGQGDRAVASMRQHLNPVFRNLDTLRERHPAYFTA